MAPNNVFPAAVVGGGPAGLAAALALSRYGLDTALVAAPPRPDARPDTRTAALFAGSVQFLVNLGVWDAIAPETAPITAIRILDDTGGMLRAPETSFTARDAGCETFGINVPNQALVTALWAAVAREPGITVFGPAPAERVSLSGDTASIALADGRVIAARLVAAADGRRSICRAAAGIATTAWTYEQSAIACTFAHSRPHHDVSTELHRAAGPLTTVPMPGRRSSLVWVERPDEANRLKALDDDAFRAELESRLQGLLGSIGGIGTRTLFPLSGLTAKPFGAARVALIGEAGHVIPPIGAQGLNLGLRDAATIAEGAGQALREGRDPGGDDVLAAYSAARMADVTSRVWTVDLLNRSLLSAFVPMRLARGAGLTALKMLGPLRRALVREGLQPSGPIPALMRAGNAAIGALDGAPRKQA